jgi:hypothetical protein
LYGRLTEEQKKVYIEIVDSALNDRGGFFSYMDMEVLERLSHGELCHQQFKLRER